MKSNLLATALFSTTAIAARDQESDLSWQHLSHETCASKEKTR